MECRITISNKYGNKTPIKLIKTALSGVEESKENYFDISLRQRSPIVDINLHITTFEFFCKLYVAVQNSILGSKKDKSEMSKIISRAFEKILESKEPNTIRLISDIYNLSLCITSIENMQSWIIFPINVYVYENKGLSKMFRKGKIVASGSIIFDYDSRKFDIENDNSTLLEISNFIEIEEAISFVIDYNNGSLQDGDEFMKSVDERIYCIKINGRY